MRRTVIDSDSESWTKEEPLAVLLRPLLLLSVLSVCCRVGSSDPREAQQRQQ